MSSRQSPGRRLRRRLMKEQGATFADRVRESVRTGKPVQTVQFTNEKPAVKPA